MNPVSEQFVAYINNRPVGFCAVLPQPHPIAKKLRRVTRLVVLPDYQGVGVGGRLLNWVAEYYKKQGYRFTIITTNPALINHFQKSNNWKLYRQNRLKRPSKASIIDGNRDISNNRITTAWEFKNSKEKAK